VTEHRNDSARHAIAEEAARWLLDARSADAAQRAAFVAWLKSSPLHVEEFLFATATLKELQGRAQTDTGEVERIIADALAGAGPSNVVALHPHEPEREARQTRAPRFWSGLRICATAAAIALIALVGGYLAYTRMVDVEVYVTGIGEQRTIRLDDGSLLYLNAHSQLEVRYSRQLREIDLGEGESIFQVAHESGRPFRVRAGTAVVEAVGTRFNVSRRGTEATVSVLEGKVRVGADEAVERALSLAAGQQARIVGGQIIRDSDADVAQAVAWRERRLVFRDDRLEQVAEEFGRYSPRRIRLEGHAARDQRITGTFDADDPEALILFLEGVEGLSVAREGGNFTVRSR
jgi:transmembrane sensor